MVPVIFLYFIFIEYNSDTKKEEGGGVQVKNDWTY